MEKIVLALLGAKGDCVYGTTLAHQIRRDYPNCHLVWAISSACRDVVRNNPHINEVWEIKADAHVGTANNWGKLAEELKNLTARGHIHKAILAQIFPDNFQNYDGTIRPSIFRAYNRPITVPIQGVVILDEEEKEAVRSFVTQHGLDTYPHRILFECTGKSMQSTMTVEQAVLVAESVSNERDDCCFIISTDAEVASSRSNIVSARSVTYRENLELIRYCNLFVGCGSGITALVSTCVKDFSTPCIQSLAMGTSVYASFAHDFAYWNLDASPFFEMRDPNVNELATAILAFLDGNRAEAERLRRTDKGGFFDLYIKAITERLLNEGRVLDAAYSLSHTVKRYGWHVELMEIARFVIDNLEYDQHLTKVIHAAFIRDFCKSFTQNLRNMKK